MTTGYDEDDEQQREGEELAELMEDRLVAWAESDSDVQATAAGIDIGTVTAVASLKLCWTIRALLAEAADGVIRDLDLSPVAQVRLHQLVSLYFDPTPNADDDV